MSVVHSRFDDYSGQKPCTLCGEEPNHKYPFLHWDQIVLCNGCCKTIKNGFMADLIEVVAGRDLQIIGYGSSMFVRTDRERLEKEGLKEQEAIRKAGR